MRDRRRKAGSFLCALFLVLSLCGCGAGGQEASTESEEESAEQYDLYRVGIVQESEDELWNTVTKSIQRELYVKGKQAGIRFDYKKYTEVADGNRALIDEIGQDFLDAEVDGIIAVGPLAAMRMKQCTKGTGIPVVFAVTSDPLEEGLLKSMERPEGNITGAADIIEIRTLLQMMISADSDIERVGLLYNGENESSRQSMAEAKRYLDSKGIGFEEATGSNEDEIFSAAYALVEDGVDAVITPADPAVQNCEQSIYQLFVDAGIPHYGEPRRLLPYPGAVLSTGEITAGTDADTGGCCGQQRDSGIHRCQCGLHPKSVPVHLRRSIQYEDRRCAGTADGRTGVLLKTKVSNEPRKVESFETFFIHSYFRYGIPADPRKHV